MSTHSTPAKGSPNGNSILIQRFLDRLSLYVGADEAESWRSDPRFHYNVKALQEFINEAEKSGNRNGGHEELQAQIRHFMAQAQEYQGALELASVPSYVEPCREVDDSTSTQLDTSSPDGAVSEAQAKAFSALRASGPNSRLMNAQALGDDVYNRLSTQEDVQEELTDQMAVMAAQLRSQAEAQSSALQAQDVALDSAAQGLLKSVHGVTAVVSDTKTAVKRTRRSMFFFLFLMFGVSMVFLGMYGFINVTAMTQAFVPYSTVASTWNTPRARGTAPRPETVRPVTAHQASPGEPEASVPLKAIPAEVVLEAVDEKEAEMVEADIPAQATPAEQELQVAEEEEDDAECEEEYPDENTDVDVGSIEQSEETAQQEEAAQQQEEAAQQQEDVSQQEEVAHPEEVAKPEEVVVDTEDVEPDVVEAAAAESIDEEDSGMDSEDTDSAEELDGKDSAPADVGATPSVAPITEPVDADTDYSEDKAGLEAEPSDSSAHDEL